MKSEVVEINRILQSDLQSDSHSHDEDDNAEEENDLTEPVQNSHESEVENTLAFVDELFGSNLDPLLNAIPLVSDILS